MKAILQSIKPQYCELIAAGKKTIEVRKTKPSILTPFKVYIYCTKEELLTKSHFNGRLYVASNKNRQIVLEKVGNVTYSGKVIGEFVCDSIDTLLESDTRRKWKEAGKASCLTFQQLDEYSGTDEKTLYLWHISNIVIYDEPKELSEFKKANRKECFYSDLGLAIPKCEKCNYCNLTHPPQSWCYVEEI